jgi:N-formylglutamate amidohydrolase
MRDDEALTEWWEKISSSSDPIRQLHAFQLGIEAATMHDAANMAAEIESEGAEEVAGILEAHAQTCDKMFGGACGE